ncbi:MAG: AAA family ATPase, partial [Desulfococcaceae bacterium]
DLIIGANGAGKSRLFEFLRLLRDACHGPLPGRLLPGPAVRQPFRRPGPESCFWNAQVEGDGLPLFYQGELVREAGEIRPVFERIFTKKSIDAENPGGFTFLDFRDGRGLVRDPADGAFIRKEWRLPDANRLGLGTVLDANLPLLNDFRRYLTRWRFFKPAAMDLHKMRRPARLDGDDLPSEDGGNLNAVLYRMQKDHPEAFEDLKSLLQFAIPGFRSLEVREIGDGTEFLAFWREDGVDEALNVADLSDGVLRFMALASLCLVPEPPPLICIDDPGLGLHPRTLPVLAGLFEKAAERTQVLLATHDGYFLTQFDPENLAVIKKTPDGSVYAAARHSETLMERLRQVQGEDLERMFRGDELETLF